MTQTDAGRSDMPPQRVKIWDVPTRLFHWSVVVLIPTSWLTADLGYMRAHLVAGLTLLTLLLFRLSWGFIGSTTARFSDLLHAPPKVIEYLKALAGGAMPVYAGHNPAGGLMALTLIAALLTQVGTGLFSNDGVQFHGPLALWVSAAASDRLTELHGTMFKIILLCVWIHLVAVFFYLFVKGENLLKPMITGYKHRDHVPSKLNLRFVRSAIALTVLAAVAGMVGLIALL